MNLVSPDFVALIPSTPQTYTTSKEIIGYTFELNSGVYYRLNGGVTRNIKIAVVYGAETVAIVSRVGGWGHKSMGKFRAVYEGDGYVD